MRVTSDLLKVVFLLPAGLRPFSVSVGSFHCVPSPPKWATQATVQNTLCVRWPSCPWAPLLFRYLVRISKKGPDSPKEGFPNLDTRILSLRTPLLAPACYCLCSHPLILHSLTLGVTNTRLPAESGGLLYSLHRGDQRRRTSIRPWTQVEFTPLSSPGAILGSGWWCRGFFPAREGLIWSMNPFSALKSRWMSQLRAASGEYLMC